MQEQVGWNGEGRLPPWYCKECNGTGMQIKDSPHAYRTLITCPPCAGTGWVQSRDMSRVVFNRPASKLKRSRICYPEQCEWKWVEVKETCG